MSSALNELELELEHECEHEHEHEHEHELEFEHEHEHELEFEHEHELELGSGREQEAFFNHLAAMADRGGASQALRRVALDAGRAALRGVVQSPPAVEGEFELEHEQEMELELEFDPVRRGNLQAMLEHMSHAASEASSEQEAAEHFLPLIPLAAKFALPLLGKGLAKGLGKAALKLAPKLLKKVVPNLTRGIGRLARSLFRRRRMRPLLRALPRIARSTMWRLGRMAARGRRITPTMAARTLAIQTARTLGSPRTLARTFRHSRAHDRRYHRRSASVLGAPATTAMTYGSAAAPVTSVVPMVMRSHRRHRSSCCCCC